MTQRRSFFVRFSKQSRIFAQSHRQFSAEESESVVATRDWMMDRVSLGMLLVPNFTNVSLALRLQQRTKVYVEFYACQKPPPFCWRRDGKLPQPHARHSHTAAFLTYVLQSIRSSVAPRQLALRFSLWLARCGTSNYQRSHSVPTS